MADARRISLGSDETFEAFEQFVDVHRRDMGDTAMAQKIIGQGREAIRLGDDHAGELAEIVVGYPALQKLGGTTQASEGIFYLMSEPAKGCREGRGAVGEFRCERMDLNQNSGVVDRLERQVCGDLAATGNAEGDGPEDKGAAVGQCTAQLRAECWLPHQARKFLADGGSRAYLKHLTEGGVEPEDATVWAYYGQAGAL